MHGAAITYRVQIASLDLHDGAEPMPDTHPSLIAKPALSVAELHLIAKLMDTGEEDISFHFTAAELQTWDDLTALFNAYLTTAVGPEWADQEALVA